MEQTVLQVLSARDATEAARRAAKAFESGGLVVFPTETVYGVGSTVTHEKGYEALRRLKGRDSNNQPFSLHAPTVEAAERYVDAENPQLRRLLRKMLPGPVTLIVDVPDEVIERKLGAMGLPASMGERLYYQNTIGLRCPDDDTARLVLGSTDAPVVASSANLRGQAPPWDGESAAASIGNDVDLLIDSGRTRYAMPSTVVRVTLDGGGYGFSIEREGVYDERFIRKLMRWTVLIVCSGNTCRSPMAEALTKQILARQRGIEPEALEGAGVQVVSAGVHAGPGVPASEQAVAVMRGMGLDIAEHRSRPLTRELVHEADLVYCMGDSHRQAVLEMAPQAAEKTFLLDEQGDITDPFGADTAMYERTAEQIRDRLEARLKEQQR